MRSTIVLLTCSLSLTIAAAAAAQTPEPGLAPAPSAPVVAIEDESGPWAWSIVAGAGVISGTAFQSTCRWDDKNDGDEWNDEMRCYDEEIDTGSAAVGELQGFVGLKVSRGLLTHALGYQLHLSLDDTGVVHRHSLAVRTDVLQRFYLTGTLGYSRVEPFGDGEGVGGFTFGFAAHVAIWGPFVIGGHFVADGFESTTTLLKTWGLTFGVAG